MLFRSELLETIGFGPRWRRWICLLLSSASSAVLLNGRPGPAIRHGRGLRQGDPISPMLFILAIDPLHHLFRLATEEGLLRPIRQRPIRCTVSLYADDAGIFVSPDVEDLKVASKILEIFADATGLRTNLAKSVILPVRCTEEQIAAALTHFPATRGSFPCTYLGLPRKLKEKPSHQTREMEGKPGYLIRPQKNLARGFREVFSRILR